MIVLDGAMGTELQARGVDTTLPLWSARALMTSPEVVREIHRDYAMAGADVLTVNTFRTNKRTLQRAGLGPDAPSALTARAVALARQAADDAAGELATRASTRPNRIRIAGSVAPVEDCYSPELVPEQAALLAEHNDHVRNQVQAGADLILVETMNTIREAEAACAACVAHGAAFWASFTLATDGRLHSGERLEDALRAVLAFQPAALLVNCLPVAQVASALEVVARVAPAGLPFGAYGNVGHVDDTVGWTLTHAVDPDEYTVTARAWHKLGATIIGGCCGTSPSHIAALSAYFKRNFSNSAA